MLILTRIYHYNSVLINMADGNYGNISIGVKVLTNLELATLKAQYNNNVDF